MALKNLIFTLVASCVGILFICKTNYDTLVKRYISYIIKHLLKLLKVLSIFWSDAFRRTWRHLLGPHSYLGRRKNHSESATTQCH
jgi:hypothetical protein